ncbi:MAG: hypothetical protein ACJ71G_03400 [Nitrososphaeraceae archaeon]
MRAEKTIGDSTEPYKGVSLKKGNFFRRQPREVEEWSWRTMKKKKKNGLYF